MFALLSPGCLGTLGVTFLRLEESKAGLVSWLGNNVGLDIVLDIAKKRCLHRFRHEISLGVLDARQSGKERRQALGG